MLKRQQVWRLLQLNCIKDEELLQLNCIKDGGTKDQHTLSDVIGNRWDKGFGQIRTRKIDVNWRLVDNLCPRELRCVLCKRLNGSERLRAYTSRPIHDDPW